MSHTDSSALAAYNSLMDPHLGGYFSNLKMRKHLRKSGLITRSGEIVSENTYRLNMARKEHKKHVRDLLAQAIVHKTLDMERNRQVVIRKKLEEIAKMELVRRVRGSPNYRDQLTADYYIVTTKRHPRRNNVTQTADICPNCYTECHTPHETERSRKGDEEILPYLSPRPKSAKGSRSRPTSGKPVGGRPKSAPSRGRDRSNSPTDEIVVLDDDGVPITPQSRSDSGGSTPRANSPPKKSRYPRGEIDDRHLYSLNQQTLREYTMARYNVDRGLGPSPYLMNQLPSPPQSARTRSPRKNRRTVTATDAMGRPVRPKSNKGSLALHRKEPAMRHQDKPHSNVEVTIHYFGSNLKLDCEKFDPRDDVVVEQQHCGGNTLTVYKEKIIPGTCFVFTSRRHRGFPFGLTFYVNGLEDCRLSACCEYKHRLGSKLGGRQGHFGIRSIRGAAPCYKCQVSEEMRDNDTKSRRKTQRPQEEEKEDVEVAVEDKDQTDGKTQRETTRSEYNVKGEGDEETQREKDHNESVEVPVEDQEEKDSKEDYSYDDDFDDEKKSPNTGRSSRSSASSRSSRSSSSSSSTYSGQQAVRRARSRSYSSDSSGRRSRSSSYSSRSSSASDTERSRQTQSPGPLPVQADQPRDTAVRSPTPKKSDSITGQKSPTPSGQRSPTGQKSPTGQQSPTGERSPTGQRSPTPTGLQEGVLLGLARPRSPSSDSDMSIPRRERSISFDRDDRDSFKTPDNSDIEWRQSPRQQSTQSPRLDNTQSPTGEAAESEKADSYREEASKSPQSQPTLQPHKAPVLTPDSTPSHTARSTTSSSTTSTDSTDSSDSSETETSAQPTPKRVTSPTKQSSVSDSPPQEEDEKVAVSTAQETDQQKVQVDTTVEDKDKSEEREASEAEDRDSVLSGYSKQDSIIDNVPDEALYESKYESIPSATIYNRIQSPTEKKEEMVPPPAPVLVSKARDSDSSDDSSESSSDSDSDSDSDTETEDKAHSSSSSAADKEVTRPTLVHRPFSQQMAFKIAKPDKSVPESGVNGAEKEDSIRSQVEGRSDLELTGKVLKPTQVDELCECIRENGTVHSLTLRNSGVDDESMGKLAKVLVDTAPSTDLRMLNVNCNNITEAGVKHVLSIVTAKTDMKILLMHGNPLDNAGVGELIKGLVQTHHFRQSDEERLSKDELQSIRATAQDLVSDVMKDILHTSSASSTDSHQSKGASGGLPLTQLDIGDCGMTEKGAVNVADLISANTNIRTLGLTGNKNIGITGWLAIADALRNNTRILSLSLDYNDLGDAGAAILAEALRENTSVRELDLEGNKIGEEGASRILEMLADNHSLQDVTLFRGNNISDETLEKISRALKK